MDGAVHWMGTQTSSDDPTRYIRILYIIEIKCSTNEIVWWCLCHQRCSPPFSTIPQFSELNGENCCVRLVLFLFWQTPVLLHGLNWIDVIARQASVAVSPSPCCSSILSKKFVELPFCVRWSFLNLFLSAAGCSVAVPHSHALAVSIRGSFLVAKCQCGGRCLHDYLRLMFKWTYRRLWTFALSVSLSLSLCFFYYYLTTFSSAISVGVAVIILHIWIEDAMRRQHVSPLIAPAVVDAPLPTK